MKVSITSAVVGLILIACSHGSPEVTAAPSPDAVKAAIAANNQAFAKAIIAKDTTALTNLFTDGAVFIAPIGGFIHGRAALAALWAERLQKASFLDGGITTESLDVRGDLAIRPRPSPGRSRPATTRQHGGRGGRSRSGTATSTASGGCWLTTRRTTRPSSAPVSEPVPGRPNLALEEARPAPAPDEASPAPPSRRSPSRTWI